MEQSRKSNKKVLDIFLPGMITAYGYRGCFPAISITGPACTLGCEHCRGYLLKSMYHTEYPEKLINLLKDLKKKGMIGALLSGGCDSQGKMPWKKFLPFLSKFNFELYLIAHGGMNISGEIAKMFKQSPIKQVLIDVIGDAETLRDIYHINDFEVMEKTLENVYSAGLKVAPHVIVGLNKGKIKGEYKALDMLSKHQTERVILVVLMPGILKVKPPFIEDVIDVFIHARKTFKHITLGCARPKGRYRRELEIALIEKKLVDAMALWSDEAVEKAINLGYSVNFYEGCCSIPLRKHIPILEQSYSIGVFKGTK